MADVLEQDNPITPELMQQYQDMKNTQATPEFDPELLNSIRSRPDAPGFVDQMKSLWKTLKGPGYEETHPGQVPYSSKFANADEWDAYNKALRDQNAPPFPSTGASSGTAEGGIEGIPADPDLNNAAKLGALAGVNAFNDPDVNLGPGGEQAPNRAIAGGGQGPKNSLDVDLSGAKKLASNGPVSMGGADQSFVPKELNMGEGALGSRENLMMAQQLANSGEFTSRLGAAANLIGAGIARAKPAGQELFDANAKDAQNVVKNYKDAVAQEKTDPNSPVSKLFREYAEKLGVKINGDFSAADGEKLIPMIFKGFEAEQTRTAHSQDLQYKMNQLAEMKREHDQVMSEHSKAQKEAKDEAQANKDFAAANKLVTAEVASSRSVFGRNANIVRASNAIEQIVGTTPLDQLSQVQTQELATSLDSMLKNGTGTVAGQKGLVPESFIGDLKKFGSKALNRPLGMDQGAFVKNLLEVVRNEKNVAQQAVNSTQDKLLRGYSHLRVKYPDRWEETFGDIGLSAHPQVAQEDQLVPITRTSDGVTKMVPQKEAKKYLAMPGFESGGG